MPTHTPLRSPCRTRLLPTQTPRRPQSRNRMWLMSEPIFLNPANKIRSCYLDLNTSSEVKVPLQRRHSGAAEHLRQAAEQTRNFFVRITQFRKSLPKSFPNRSRHTRKTCTQLIKENEREIVRDTWKHIVHKAQMENEDLTPSTKSMSVGMALMRRLIKKEPKLATVFQVEDHKLDGVINVNNVKEDSLFMRHARITQSFLELMLRNLDDLEVQVGQALLMYGRRHCSNLSLPVDDAAEYLRSMLTTISDLVNDALEFAEEDQVQIKVILWTQILQFMSRKLTEGYKFELMTNSRKLPRETSVTEADRCTFK